MRKSDDFSQKQYFGLVVLLAILVFGLFYYYSKNKSVEVVPEEPPVPVLWHTEEQAEELLRNL